MLAWYADELQHLGEATMVNQRFCQERVKEQRDVIDR